MGPKLQSFKSRLAFILLSVLPSPAAFGGQVGNGGKGVICRDQTGAILSAQLLDFYEQRSFGEELKIPAIGDSFAIADALLQRLTPYDPLRANQYRTTLGK